MSGRDTEWRGLADADARDNPHHENCDTRDKEIPGKPCNCYIHWHEAYYEAMEGNKLLRAEVERLTKRAEAAERQLAEARAVIERIHGRTDEAITVSEEGNDTPGGEQDELAEAANDAHNYAHDYLTRAALGEGEGEGK